MWFSLDLKIIEAGLWRAQVLSWPISTIISMDPTFEITLFKIFEIVNKNFVENSQSYNSSQISA